MREAFEAEEISAYSRGRGKQGGVWALHRGDVAVAEVTMLDAVVLLEATRQRWRSPIGEDEGDPTTMAETVTLLTEARRAMEEVERDRARFDTYMAVAARD
jgi:hypothetical protein